MDVISIMNDMGFPYAYDHFAEGEGPNPPFLVYQYPEAYSFSADGIPYVKLDRLHIELYTDKKQPEVERHVEKVLEAHEIYYEKSEAWIAEERLYEILYSTEVLKDEW